MISFVITTTDLSNTISACVKSILQIAGTHSEIIIVYQSKGGSKLIISQNKVSRIKILYVPYVGLSKARNMGAKEAMNDILAFIDDDIIIDSNYIVNVAYYIKKGVTAICGRILLQGTCLPYAKTHTEKPTIINTSPYRLKKCLGGNMVFKNTPFMEVGGFDEMFGIGREYGGAEDIDIVLRLLQKKYIVMYAPDVIGYHPKENRDDLPAFSRKCYLYGVGEGAVYAKHFIAFKSYSMLLNYSIEIIKPLIRLILSPILSISESNTILLSILSGRLTGFYKYKTKELRKKL